MTNTHMWSPTPVPNSGLELSRGSTSLNLAGSEFQNSHVNPSWWPQWPCLALPDDVRQALSVFHITAASTEQYPIGMIGQRHIPKPTRLHPKFEFAGAET